MKNATNKYLNYFNGLFKGCNILACVFISVFTTFILYLFDGFNLISAVGRQSAIVKAVVIITAVIGALLVFASTVKNLENKHVIFADDMVLSGAFLFVLLAVYFLISKSQAFLIYKIIALACLLIAVFVLFFIRAKFFESVEDKTCVKPNANRSTYYQNLFKRDWAFIILLSATLVALLIYLYTANVVDAFLDANNTMQLFLMIALGLVSTFMLLFSVRLKEKEQNLIDCAVFALIIASCALLIVGFMKTGKIRLATIILAVIIMAFSLVSTLVLIKNTVILNENAYKLKKGNAKLYFKKLFEHGNVVLYVAIALLLTAITAVLESTNFIHKFFETQLNAKDPTVTIEIICIILAVVFTFLLTELKGYKIHSADKIVFTMALSFAFVLILVNGVTGVEFMLEGLLTTIGLVLSVAFIVLRTFFVKDFELEQVKTPCVLEEKIEVKNEEPCVCECAKEEQVVTEEEPLKLKKVNVKKSYEIYLRTGDEQLKQNYSQVKNALLSYGLHARITKTRENFSKKGVTLSKVKEGKEIRLQAKLLVRGKFLKLYLNVNPESIDLKYFRAEDVAKKMPDQPLYIKIRSKLSLKRALELIDLLAVQENFNAKKKYVDFDYASSLTSDSLTYMQKLGYDYMIKDSVTYEEVAILNDEWAEKIVKTETVKKPERYIYDEVTLQVLESNFDDGSVVTLESMRQKSLVKINANFITVKASNSLSKKLIIEGNAIEPKAVAMIFIAGGEATRLIGE